MATTLQYTPEFSDLYIATSGAKYMNTTPNNYKGVFLNNDPVITSEVFTKELKRKVHGGGTFIHSAEKKRAKVDLQISLPDFETASAFQGSWFNKLLDISYLKKTTSADTGAKATLENQGVRYTVDSPADKGGNDFTLQIAKGEDIDATTSDKSFTTKATISVAKSTNAILITFANVIQAGNNNDTITITNEDILTAIGKGSTGDVGNITYTITDAVNNIISGELIGATADIAVLGATAFTGGGTAGDGAISANEALILSLTDSASCEKYGSVIIKEENKAHLLMDVSAYIKFNFVSNDYTMLNITLYGRHEIVDVQDDGTFDIPANFTDGNAANISGLESASENESMLDYLTGVSFGNKVQTGTTSATFDTGVKVSWLDLSPAVNSAYITEGYNPSITIEGMESTDWSAEGTSSTLNSKREIKLEIEGDTKYEFLAENAKLSSMPIRGSVQGFRNVTKVSNLEKNATKENYKITITFPQ